MLLGKFQRLTGTVDTDITSAANLEVSRGRSRNSRLLWKHVWGEENRLGEDLE
jgi:hypothetical protein